MLNPWLALTFKTIQLGLDAQSVIALRMTRLASGGPAAEAEMSLMVIDKAEDIAEAHGAATRALMTGSKDHVVAGKTLDVFSKRVRANKRRLSRR